MSEIVETYFSLSVSNRLDVAIVVAVMIAILILILILTIIKKAKEK